MPFELGGLVQSVKPHDQEHLEVTILNRLIKEKTFVAASELFTRTPKTGDYATVVSPTPLENFSQIRVTSRRPVRMGKDDLNVNLG